MTHLHSAGPGGRRTRGVITADQVLICVLMACASTPPEPAAESPVAEEPSSTPRHAGLFAALPQEMTSAHEPGKEALVDLGRMLYFDPRLSKDRNTSCNTCHTLGQFGVSQPFASSGKPATRDIPSTYHSGLHASLGWDGRAEDLESQAAASIVDPTKMAMPSLDEAAALLADIPGYAEAFATAWPESAQPVSPANITAALGTFTRGLSTPSPVDAYLSGNLHALTEAQLEGMDLFVNTGCVTCHNGVAVGGQMFQPLGLTHPYPTDDPGRAAITGQDRDRHFFKVPSLRNITRTGPYLHDGSVERLEEVVRLMAYHQLGKKLEEREVTGIVEFLGALEGTPDPKYIRKPDLPGEATMGVAPSQVP